MNNRGISSVLGYMLVASIIILALSIVFVHSYAMVKKSESSTKLEGVIQGFENLADVVRYSEISGSPFEKTNMNVGGGLLGVGDKFEIHVEIKKNGETIYNKKFVSKILYYKYSKYEAAFEDGGVWLSSSGYSTIVLPPKVFRVVPVNGLPVLFIDILNLNGSGSVYGGYANILVYSNSSKTRTLSSNNNLEINITIVSKFADAWKTYLSKTLNVKIKPPVNNTINLNLNNYRIAVITLHNMTVNVRGV